MLHAAAAEADDGDAKVTVRTGGLCEAAGAEASHRGSDGRVLDERSTIELGHKRGLGVVSEHKEFRLQSSNFLSEAQRLRGRVGKFLPSHAANSLRIEGVRSGRARDLVTLTTDE